MKVESPFHSAFKLQGKSFISVEELLAFSKKISSEVNSFLIEWFDTNTYVEVKTSGSTGNPKVIQLQKKFMINSAKATGEYFKLPKNTIALLCMSPNFIAGKMMLVRALTLGWQLDVVEVNSNPLKNINKQYDFSAMVPLQLHNSVAEIHKIKKLIVGGGVVSKELLLKIQGLDTEIFATYGMTETITHIAVKKLNNFFTERSRSAHDVVNCHFELVDSETKQSYYQTLPNIIISKDNRGCLVIDAPNLASKKLITNDLVELISATEFKWLGRFDSIINSGGIKLIPEQIEEKYSSILKQRFFVAGIPDAFLGEKLVLVIEELNTLSIQSKNEATMISTPLNQRKIIIFNKIKSLPSLSKYEIPKEIYFVQKFIETETRKINRKETLALRITN